MKLVIAGATGFVATELIRQSLRIPAITSVVAIARRPISVPENLGAGSDTSKLKSIVLQDFGKWSEDTKTELAGADACIWTLAITPTKSRSMEFEEVRRVCHDYTVVGLKALFDARNQTDTTPFRFLYMSGIAAERDQSKTPTFAPQYCLMRGEVENHVLSFTSEHKDQMEACVVKPGSINSPGFNVKNVVSTVGAAVFPSVLVTEISAAMLDQVVRGFEKDTLLNDDLVRIGRKSLRENSSS